MGPISSASVGRETPPANIGYFAAKRGRAWHSRTCATLTVTATPLISTISCDQPHFGSAEGELDGDMVAIAGAIIKQRTGAFDPTAYRDRC